MEIFRDLKRVCEQNDIQYFMAYGSLLGAVRHKGFIPWDEDIDIWMTRDNFQKLCRHREEFRGQFELFLPEDHGPKKYDANVPRLLSKTAYIKMDEELTRFYNGKNNKLHVDIFLIDRTYDDIRGKIQSFELYFLYALMNGYRSKAFDYSYYSPLMRFIVKCFALAGKCFPLVWLERQAEKVSERYDARKDTDLYKVTTDSFIGMRRRFPREALDRSVLVPFEDIQVPVPCGYDTILRTIYGEYMKLPPEEEQTPHFGVWYDLKNTQVAIDDIVIAESKGTGA